MAAAMDPVRFAAACAEICESERATNGIGTLGEKTLHAVLKQYFSYSAFADQEIRVGPFVADIVGENGIIEIQTRSFHKLRHKLEALLDVGVVTVVYPVAKTKWLSWIDPQTGEVTKRRKSPKKGRPQDAFSELYAIKACLRDENFRLCIVLLEVEELRYLNGWSRDKKKGSSRCDRVPLALLEQLDFETFYDWTQLLPENLPETFLAKDYQRAAGISLRTAQTGLHLLHHIGVAERVGKQGNAYLYRRV